MLGCDVLVVAGVVENRDGLAAADCPPPNKPPPKPVEPVDVVPDEKILEVAGWPPNCDAVVGNRL